MDKEVILTEPVGTLKAGTRGKIITKYNDLYFVDFSKYVNPTHYLWVKPSKVKLIASKFKNKSNFIGE